MHYSIDIICFLASIYTTKGIRQLSYKDLFNIKSNIEANMQGIITIEVDRDAILVASHSDYLEMGKKTIRICDNFKNRITASSDDTLDFFYINLPQDVKERYLEEVRNATIPS